jgi:hypothetical protein
MLAAQDPFGCGENTENDGGRFAGEAGLDDETAELDFVPGIEPAFGISDAPHPNLIAPYQRSRSAQQLCGFCLFDERRRRRRATS